MVQQGSKDSGNSYLWIEFVAARQCVEQIIDMRYTLRMMGVPIKGASLMLGDDKAVVTSSAIASSVLNKRHNALACDRVRESIAAGIALS